MGTENHIEHRNVLTPNVAIILSPNFDDYARQHLKECIGSIERQEFEGNAKVFITDNESSPESYVFLQNIVPEAQIIACKENQGFAGGNNLAMQAAIDEGYEYLLLINMDTIMAPNCIRDLLALAQKIPQGAAFQARLMLWPEKDRINSTGNQTHFLGFGFCREFGEKNSKNLRPSKIAHPSGAAVLMRSEVLKTVGLFDEDFWMYCEDLDLGWRLWLAGYECWYVPEAVVYHKYVFMTRPDKFYWLDRNRVFSILKNYHIGTLLLIIPAFLLMEIGTLLHAVSNGWLKQKISVWGWFLNPVNWARIFRSRKKVQALRKKSDREIVKRFCGKVDFDPIASIAIQGANVVFSFYWWLVRKLIVW